MGKILSESEIISEKESLKRKSIFNQFDTPKIKINGILFILWGWISFTTYLGEYIVGSITYSYFLSKLMRFAEFGLPVLGLCFTGIYIYRNKNNITTVINLSVIYVWVALLTALVLVNMIQFNVLNKIIFMLQHPVFMVMIAFAIYITGVILRNKMIFAGGIAFGFLAYIGSFFDLHEQLLVEAIAWLIAFIIPGHILYSKYKD